jgi:transcriptional regulator with XRE-family HTH domain
MSSGFSAFSEDLAMRVGQRIRDARAARGWIQSDLARAAKLPVRTIGRIERGEVDARLSSLVRLAKALRMEPKDLLP